LGKSWLINPKKKQDTGGKRKKKTLLKREKRGEGLKKSVIHWSEKEEISRKQGI